MTAATLRAARSRPPRRRYQFGLRWLLMTVTLLAIALGWIAHLHRKARERSALTAELVRMGVLVELEEPTGVGQFVRKVLPTREAWLRERIGAGWFSLPTVFLCRELNEEQVPEVVERLSRLGTVKELYLDPQQLPQLAAQMRRGLPGVEVLPNQKAAVGTYYRSRTSQAHLAIEGLGVAALVVLAVLGAAVMIAWPLIRRRRLPRDASTT